MRACEMIPSHYGPCGRPLGVKKRLVSTLARQWVWPSAGAAVWAEPEAGKAGHRRAIYSWKARKVSKSRSGSCKCM
jgi:hypothetical protein